MDSTQNQTQANDKQSEPRENNSHLSNSNKEKGGGVTIEKLLLVILFFITFFQFSMWATQSVRHILHTMYGTNASTTPLDFVIGIIAMTGAGLVFAGSAMWWRENSAALPFMMIGTALFMAKNVFDTINTIWIFNLENEVINEALINQLAVSVGNELFQLAFWIFVFFFARYKMNKLNNNSQL